MRWLILLTAVLALIGCQTPTEPHLPAGEPDSDTTPPFGPYFEKSGASAQQRDNDLQACDARIAPISARDRAEKFAAPDDDCGHRILFRKLKDCMQD